MTPAPTMPVVAVHSASRLAPDSCWAAQVVLVDCTTQIAALGTWGIGPQQLGQARSSRLLHMLHSTWSPQSLTVNYLAMEVRCLCPSCVLLAMRCSLGRSNDQQSGPGHCAVV